MDEAILEKQLFHGSVEKEEILNTGWGATWNPECEKEHNHTQMQLHKMTHLEGRDRTGQTAHKEQRPKVCGVRTCENPRGNTSVYPAFPSRLNNLWHFVIHPRLHLGQACPDLENNRWQTESGLAFP